MMLFSKSIIYMLNRNCFQPSQEQFISTNIYIIGMYLIEKSLYDERNIFFWPLTVSMSLGIRSLWSVSADVCYSIEIGNFFLSLSPFLKVSCLLPSNSPQGMETPF